MMICFPDRSFPGDGRDGDGGGFLDGLAALLGFGGDERGDQTTTLGPCPGRATPERAPEGRSR